ncbi:hypothetical protein GOODEAATRI_014248 [Goodea atripinnis]|uniref:Uncharacterized protein n=1 Tax=Goodea atripinnis TaxID=208336 RepID=A0ABV0NAN0_9TELE
MINNRRDEQNVIRQSGNISYLCVRSRMRPGDLQITARRKSTHRQKRRNEKDASGPTDTEEALLYDLKLPPRPPLHTHTHRHSSENCTHMLWTTHCLVDLFKSQELCLSFPTSCSQKYL